MYIMFSEQLFMYMHKQTVDAKCIGTFYNFINMRMIFEFESEHANAKLFLPNKSDVLFGYRNVSLYIIL